MDEQIEILRAIFCRSNEIISEGSTPTITYNAFDDQQQCIAFSATVHEHAVVVESTVLTKAELVQLRSRAASSTTNLYELFTSLKCFYDELMAARTPVERQTTDDISSSILMKIDHMRSPNTYMKHLRQWSNELQITGRVLVVSHGIFILIEGKIEDVKKFIVRLKTESIDIDSRGRPCKERLLTQLVELTDYSSKFSNFEKIEFNNRSELISFLIKNEYEMLIDYVHRS